MQPDIGQVRVWAFYWTSEQVEMFDLLLVFLIKIVSSTWINSHNPESVLSFLLETYHIYVQKSQNNLQGCPLLGVYTWSVAFEAAIVFRLLYITSSYSWWRVYCSHTLQTLITPSNQSSQQQSPQHGHDSTCQPCETTISVLHKVFLSLVGCMQKICAHYPKWSS